MEGEKAGEFQSKAIKIVRKHVEEYELDISDGEVPYFEVYVVWFSKTLQNWKALLSTTLPNGMYYEVTHNGDKRETYLDSYKKFRNECVRDEVFEGTDFFGKQDNKLTPLMKK